MIHRDRHRRAEGHVEYIIITSLIMVCALVGFFSMINNIKQIAQNLKICSDCPDGKHAADAKSTKVTDADAAKTGDPSQTGDPNNPNNPSANPPPSYPSWLAEMISWFSGAKWFWDSYVLA